METSTKWVVLLIWGLIAGAIAYTAWMYLVREDFVFQIETPCDPSEQSCFYRDCSSTDAECPENGLEEYRVFRIKAKDFNECVADACAEVCVGGSAVCEEELCSSSSENTCSSPDQSVSTW